MEAAQYPEEEELETDAMLSEQAEASPRMPEVKDFPPIAQREIAAKTGRVVEDLAAHSKNRRRSLLDRLTAGIGGRKESAPVPVEPQEPALSSQFGAEPAADPHARHAAETGTARVSPMDNRIDPDIDDEQLEIPAFLRRQAN